MSRFTAVVILTLSLVGGVACGFFGGQPRSVKDCWDEADDHANDRIRGNVERDVPAECAPNQTMDECPAWPDIEAELKANQERCK